MTYQNDRPTLVRHLAHLPQALLLKRGISDREHLVDQQNLRLKMSRDGESET
jgi:hypothetical protein